MTKKEVNIIKILQSIDGTMKDMLDEIRSMHNDIIDLIQLTAETEIQPQVIVETSTAQEIKEALKPVSVELVRRRTP